MSDSAQNDLERFSSIERISKGSLWSMITWVTSMLSGVVMVTILVRLMSSSQYGLYATAYAFINVGGVFAGLGIGTALVQVGTTQITLNGMEAFVGIAKKAQSLSWTIAVCLCALSLVLVLFFSSFVGISHYVVVLPLLFMIPVAALLPVSNTYGAILRVLFKPRTIALIALLTALVQICLISVAGYLKLKSATDMALIRSLVAGVNVLLLMLVTFRLISGYQKNLKTEAIKKLITFGSSVLLTGVFATLVSQLDIIILSITTTSTKVALYQPASRLFDLVAGIPSIIAMFVMPELTRYTAKSDTRNVSQLYHWSSRWNFCLCSPVVGLMLIMPASVLQLAFGRNWVIMSTPLKILMLGMGIHLAFGLNGLVLDAYAQVRSIVVRLVVSIFISVGACVILIPKFDVVGAAWATVLAITASNIFCSIQIFMNFKILPWDISMFATCLAFVAVIAGGFMIFRDQIYSVTWMCCVALLIGMITTGVSLIFTPKDAKRLFSMLCGRAKAIFN